jgi:membrane protease YdiL (CAAX protease family)
MLVGVINGVAEENSNRGMVLATPLASILLAVAFIAVRHQLWCRDGSIFTRRQIRPSITLGVVIWFAIVPCVFGVHFATHYIALQAGYPPDKHPLSILGAGDSVAQQVIFGLAVCLFTPIAEEVLFRGLLVGWAAGRLYRPYLLLLTALMLALLVALSPQPTLAPACFMMILLCGWAMMSFVRRYCRYPIRTWGSIYSTAAVFAAVHSSVWPTPIPLFVLGLGLGYVAARTRGILAPIILHGLFNAISFTMLLRGTAT